MQSSVQSLAGLPLFSGLSEADFETFLQLFEQRELTKGTTLFKAGVAAEFMYFLMKGSVSLQRGTEEVLVAQSPAPLGELAAMTGEDRNLTAIAASEIVVLAASASDVQKLFEANGVLGHLLHANMLRLTARKIARDRRRLVELQQNIIGTQKAMKAMRAALLESEDNPLHASLYEQLDALIEQNKRIHYLVEPSLLVPTGVQLDTGEVRRVTALSNEWVYFSDPPASVKAGAETSVVLLLDGEPLPVSGTVDRVKEGEASIFLDEMVAPILERLTRHLTRAQILDVVL